MNPIGVVYQRTDMLEAFPGADRDRIRSFDLYMKDRADLTLFCSSYLFETERVNCRRPLYVDHGVDFAHFALAGTAGTNEPPDVRALSRPRVGFVGGIDEHTFDRALFLRTARRLSDVQFVLLGTCTLSQNWCDLENVTQLGQRHYEQVAAYMAACDVLIMPWKQNDWIRACNPVKLKEYLAVGRPVVSTFFEELSRYKDVVTVARGAGEFTAAIRAALSNPGDEYSRRSRVENDTWSAKTNNVMKALHQIGRVPLSKQV